MTSSEHHLIRNYKIQSSNGQKIKVSPDHVEFSRIILCVKNPAATDPRRVTKTEIKILVLVDPINSVNI